MFVAWLSDFRFRKFAQHSVTQSRRARAAAGKSQHQHKIIRVCLGHGILKAVTDTRINPSQRRIDRIVRASADEQRKD